MPSIQSIFIQVHLARRTRDGGTEYLVLQRSSTEPLYPGMWQVITGHIEEGETALQAAVRETGEEAGQVGIELNVLPHIASFYHATRDVIHLIPVFWAVLPCDAVIMLSDEHQEYAWLPSDAVLERLPLQSHTEAHKILAGLLTREP